MPGVGLGAGESGESDVDVAGHPWWRDSVVYQVYPRSFNDTDGDGVGDIPGIIEKLDYLHHLGVDVLWLSPVYPSPGEDNGYDISDYCAIDPVFGTFADWERLRDGLHARGMRLVMDLVVNHTSDHHPWFRESRTSRDSPLRDFYIWRPGVSGGPPTNRRSLFSGSAWEHDPRTGEYYFHLFGRGQPDLNWENPEVRRRVHEVMRWWLDRGVDGFRMDVINFIAKDPDLPAPPDSDAYTDVGPVCARRPRVHEFLREMHDAALAGRDVVTIGETPGVDPEQARLYTAPERRELSMVFQFEHMDLDYGPRGKFDPIPLPFPAVRASLNRWQLGLGETGWNALYWSNHDQPRVVSRFGDDTEHRVASATMVATVLHMMRGTPFIYQGEELGMTNAPFRSVAEFRDVETLNHYHWVVDSGQSTPAEAFAAVCAHSRDHARTPMQWDATPNAGFTSGDPWIAVNPNHTSINAEAALADPESVFHYYRRLIRLRREYPIVVRGSFEPLVEDHPRLHAYTRSHADQVLLVLANWSAEALPVPFDWRTLGSRPRLLIANRADADAPHHPLRPYEARVYLLDA